MIYLGTYIYKIEWRKISSVCSYDLLPVINTYNPIDGMYNPIERTSFNHL